MATVCSGSFDEQRSREANGGTTFFDGPATGSGSLHERGEAAEDA